MELLDTINTQKVAIPDAIKNLLEKLSRLAPAVTERLSYEGGLAVDDIPLSNETMNILSEDKFKHFVNDGYGQEIQSLLEFDLSKIIMHDSEEFKKECSDERIELDFNHIIMEIIAFNEQNTLTQEDYEYYDILLQDQIEYFIGTGQYEQVMKIYKSLKLNAFENKLPQATFHIKSPKVLYQLVDSFRSVGRQNREQTIQLCKYYGEEIVAPLMEALIEEESLTIRRFLLDLIIHFGDKAASEAIKHLHDTRWFVQRNMLFILSECGSNNAIPYIRTYCYHSNPKVSFQAIRCLLKAEDSYGIKALKHYLASKQQDSVKRAAVFSGAYRIKDVVPVLIELLKKNEKSSTDFNLKILIVKALGQIGDPCALDTLRSVLSSKSLFFQRPRARLKKEIHQTLKNYSSENSNDAIEAGKSQ